MIDAALARLDATAQAAMVARGELSADELVSAAWDRLDRLNPLLRAVVAIDREARATPGPLSGVPFLMKDSNPWPGLRWSLGSRLFASQVATRHTPFGARLAEAGLACVGKSATSELGLLASTETLAEGVTHNPWNLALSAGGSSGGSAAAVAAGLVPIAHANDGGGSLRIPASLCGVFGFMPGRGRTVPAHLGTGDFVEMTSDHFVTRSVRDSALFLSLTASEPIAPVRRATLRIAAWDHTLHDEAPDPEVKRAFVEAVDLLEELGHQVERIVPLVFDGSAFGEAALTLAGASAADLVAQVDRARDVPVQLDELEPWTWFLIDRAASADVTRARDTLALASRRFLESLRSFDVVLTPVVPVPPWPIGLLSPLVAPGELARRVARIMGYTPIHNAAGCPAMSVPLHTTPSGLPIGSHFAAAPGREDVLLGLALQLEEARPWKDRWPPYSIPALASAPS